jgi:hypothetical protein
MQEEEGGGGGGGGGGDLFTGMFLSHSIIHIHNCQSLSVHLSHPVSSKWCTVKKIGKGKKCLPRRNNCGKIVHFAATCMGSTPRLFISTYFLCKKALGSQQS